MRHNSQLFLTTISFNLSTQSEYRHSESSSNVVCPNVISTDVFVEREYAQQQILATTLALEKRKY